MHTPYSYTINQTSFLRATHLTTKVTQDTTGPPGLIVKVWLLHSKTSVGADNNQRWIWKDLVKREFFETTRYFRTPCQVSHTNRSWHPQSYGKIQV